MTRTMLNYAHKIYGLSWILTQGMIWLGGPVAGILILAAVYKFMPNTFVKYKYALIGALAAVPVWLLGKWGFGLYVKYAGTTSIYGAIGLLPIFTIWLKLSCLIFLFGAELTNSCSRYCFESREEVNAG